MSGRRCSALYGVWTGGVWAALTLATVAQATDPGAATSGAPASETGAADVVSQVVRQALQHEADGDLVARDRLLGQALESDAACAAARWHRGWLQTESGQWQSVEQGMASASADAKLADYESRRSKTADTPLAQFELATWCLDHDFPLQGRAHLRRTLELSPDHLAARQLLGFKNFAGQWISPEQQAELVERGQTVQTGLARFGKDMLEISRHLTSRSGQMRAAARAKLNGISEPAAIAPAEAILGSASVDAAESAVAWLPSLADPEATMSLARFAMFHPRPTVRMAAIEQIKTRPHHDYVPAVIGMLASPVMSMAVPVVAADGSLAGFRQSFAQEQQGQTDVFVLETRINYGNLSATNPFRPGRAALPASDPLSRSEALARSLERASENNAAMQANNDRILARNRLITRFLSDVTEHNFTQPAEVWKWWDETNETERQSLKPSRVRYATSMLASRNYTQLAASMPTSGFAGECFVRGTPVITRKGPRAIETIQVGDLVLSRHIATGQLSWQPVVRTTTRPPRPVFDISLDEEKLACTGGHLFWVSGQGWTKASELRPGDILHAAAQPVVVMEVAAKSEQPTFNLEIDQTQTYFVGKLMVLSHDVTERRPTYLKVPGLTH